MYNRSKVIEKEADWMIALTISDLQWTEPGRSVISL